MIACREHRLAEELGELGRAHLTRCHRKFPMVNRAVAGCVPIDNDVVRRVGNDKIGLCPVHKPLIAVCDQRIPANDAVLTQLPQIPRDCDRSLRDLWQAIVRIGLGYCVEAIDQQINLREPRSQWSRDRSRAPVRTGS